MDDDLCLPLVSFTSDALLGPPQRPVEDLDLVRHA